MKKNSFTKIFFASALLTGCVSTIDTTDLEVVPSNETLMSIEAENIQQIQDKQTDYKILKIQPVNRKNCELSYFTFEGDISSQSNEFFWDGKCAKGKAEGLGRIFIKSDKNNIEQLVEYINTQKELSVYLINDKKNHKAYIGHAEIDLDEKTQFGYFRTLDSVKNKNENTTFFEDFLETRDVNYIYKYSQDNSYQKYTKSYCAFENDNDTCFNITTVIKPDLERVSFSTNSNSEKPKELGYVYETNPAVPEQKLVKLITPKGTVTTKDAEFPPEYLTYIREINSEIKNRVSYVPDALALAEKKLEEYRTRACSVDSVDFMAEKEYKKICE